MYAGKMKKIIYSKKVKHGLDKYHYYIKQVGDEYYVVVEAESYSQITDTVIHRDYYGKMCLKIKLEEVGKIIELLEKDPEMFEEEYGDRNDWEDC
jgi:hypothetical protein